MLPQVSAPFYRNGTYLQRAQTAAKVTHVKGKMNGNYTAG
jgi:hypothetical protein